MLQALHELSLEVRELDLGTEVQRVTWPLTPLQFYRDFVSRNKPCLLTGAINHWPALSLWNQSYLLHKLRDKQVTVAVTPDGRADAVCNIAVQSTDGSHHKPHFVLPLERQMPMADFLQRLRPQHASGKRQPSSCIGKQAADTVKEIGNTTSEEGNVSQQEVMYIQQQNGNFTSHFPELANDVESNLPWASEAFGASPDAVNLWIGNDRSVTSFHKDHYENLYAVITGEKIFTLLPPCDAYRMHLAHYPLATCTDSPHGLHVTPSGDSQQVLWCPVEDLADAPCSVEYQQHFPAYFNAALPKPMRVSVKAGEVLFLPSLWWHQVEQKAGKDDMVVAINYWYDMPFDCKYAYFKLVESLAGCDANLSVGKQYEACTSTSLQTCD